MRSRWSKYLLDAALGDVPIHPLAVQEGKTCFGARDQVRRFEDLETGLVEAGVIIKALLHMLKQKGLWDPKAFAQALASPDVREEALIGAPPPPKGEPKTCGSCKSKNPSTAKSCQFCGRPLPGSP